MKPNANMFREHTCLPSTGEWLPEENSKPTAYKDIPRPASYLYGHTHIACHYVEFAHSVFQVRTDTNDAVTMWERIQG